jgi:hypothetical protein
MILNGAISIKLLLLGAFTERGHNGGFQNGFEDLLIPLYGHKMAIGLATSVYRSSCKRSRKV